MTRISEAAVSPAAMGASLGPTPSPATPPARRWAGLIQSEAQFQAAIIDLARLLGWRAYHTYDSRRSASGFPDLVLVRPPRLIIAEVKTDDGVVAAAQRAWLEALVRCDVAAYVWRPRDMSEIARLLR